MCSKHATMALEFAMMSSSNTIFGIRSNFTSSLMAFAVNTLTSPLKHASLPMIAPGPASVNFWNEEEDSLAISEPMSISPERMKYKAWCGSPVLMRASSFLRVTRVVCCCKIGTHSFGISSSSAATRVASCMIADMSGAFIPPVRLEDNRYHSLDDIRLAHEVDVSNSAPCRSSSCDNPSVFTSVCSVTRCTRCTIVTATR